MALNHGQLYHGGTLPSLEFYKPGNLSAFDLDYNVMDMKYQFYIRFANDKQTSMEGRLERWLLEADFKGLPFDVLASYLLDAVFGDYWRKLGNTNHVHRMFVGGPRNGEVKALKNPAPVMQLDVIAPASMTVAEHMALHPITEEYVYQPTVIYKTERIRIPLNDHAHIDVPIYVHDSVPENKRIDLFMMCCEEFGVDGYPLYKIAFDNL